MILCKSWNSPLMENSAYTIHYRDGSKKVVKIDHPNPSDGEAFVKQLNNETTVRRKRDAAGNIPLHNDDEARAMYEKMRGKKKKEEESLM